MWYKKVVCEEGQVWEEETVLAINGVLKKTMGKLEKGSMGDKRQGRKKWAYNFCIKEASWARKGANKGAPAPSIDHYQAVNPYQSKYVDMWEDKIGESTHMKKYENAFFYHNALLLMMSHETMKWME
eukprot:14639574-Ditylum_brightwellii.AAC.1